MYIHTYLRLFKPVSVPAGTMLLALFFFFLHPIVTGVIGFLAAIYYTSWRRPGNGRTEHGKITLRFPWPSLRLVARRMWRWVWVIVCFDGFLYFIATMKRDLLLFVVAVSVIFAVTELNRFLFRLKLRTHGEKKWRTANLF